MSTGTLSALITSIASIAGSVAAILHSMQTKRVVRSHLAVSHPVAPVGGTPPPPPRAM